MSVTVETRMPDGSVKRVERPSVDEQSFALAEHFLRDEPDVSDDDKWDLADHIQSAVECWFSLREPEPIEPEPCPDIHW